MAIVVTDVLFYFSVASSVNKAIGWNCRLWCRCWKHCGCVTVTIVVTIVTVTIATVTIVIVTDVTLSPTILLAMPYEYRFPQEKARSHKPFLLTVKVSASNFTIRNCIVICLIVFSDRTKSINELARIYVSVYIENMKIFHTLPDRLF
jgi:hypothetical protein